MTKYNCRYLNGTPWTESLKCYHSHYFIQSLKLQYGKYTHTQTLNK